MTIVSCYSINVIVTTSIVSTIPVAIIPPTLLPHSSYYIHLFLVLLLLLSLCLPFNFHDHIFASRLLLLMNSSSPLRIADSEFHHRQKLPWLQTMPKSGPISFRHQHWRPLGLHWDSTSWMRRISWYGRDDDGAVMVECSPMSSVNLGSQCLFCDYLEVKEGKGRWGRCKRLLMFVMFFWRAEETFTKSITVTPCSANYRFTTPSGRSPGITQRPRTLPVTNFNHMYMSSPVLSLREFPLAEVQYTQVQDPSWIRSSVYQGLKMWINVSQSPHLHTTGGHWLTMRRGKKDRKYNWQIKVAEPSALRCGSWFHHLSGTLLLMRAGGGMTQ